MIRPSLALAFRLTAAILAVCLVLAAAPAPAGPSAADSQPVRLAYLQNDLHHLALWIALDKGFFSEEGLPVEVAGIFRSGPELMTAFGAGELDAAYVGQAPATIAAVRGTARIKVLAQANTEGSALVGSKALAEGKVPRPTLAIPGHGGVQELLLQKALPTLGLSADGVELVVVSPPEMLPALQSGQIDGFIAWEPYPARAVLQAIGTTIANSTAIWAGHPCCVLAAADDLIDKRPAVARSLIRAHGKATRYIADHPEEALAVAVKYTGMDEDVARRAMAHVTYVETPSLVGEEEYVRFLITRGVIKVEDAAAFTRSFIDLPTREAAAR
ncbi:nitrate/sulfonate/taurine/bicarbonate ABC transporter periplasmic protein [Solidesulfovibrio carbinoliphilus subsp. oakridgensis]|uniref:Nitrate/sulfonate/taurine/bicarbonate ABC transporter periplasmic protein n=1 Tax=Solidesulfovibrio carbinoliphilus subsp. oakridgensis TaxID=694327 RepID=G7Q7K3_9BACT|nr:ABC transporter substrate-binding protein [Solidesulfovibrio carbinoliphilus]EHJ47156.1 nitrate/sulfonate/taurine/bicarbonate ABC transporter periplasmic protein [Solidesulfovibrio carbinoliphilus subsp. oakridgensis]